MIRDQAIACGGANKLLIFQIVFYIIAVVAAQFAYTASGSHALREEQNLLVRDTYMGKCQDTKKDAKKKPQKSTKEKKLAKLEKKNKQYE